MNVISLFLSRAGGIEVRTKILEALWISFTVVPKAVPERGRSKLSGALNSDF